jgi:5-formyltetrahydrofolate cyclo-ligase
VLLDEAKRTRRTEAVRAVEALPPARRALEEELVTAAIQGDPMWHDAKSVLLYRSVGKEFSTVGLANGAWRAGKSVLFPRVNGDHLTLHAVRAWSELRPGYRGIPEPAGMELPPATPELAIVPGTAYDAEGGRVGRGGGFYDRLIPTLDCPVWAPAFDCQVGPPVPRSQHDAKVHRVWAAHLLQAPGS